MVTVGLSVTLLGFGILVLWFNNQTCPDWPLLNAVAWVGRYSYSIYLWNMVVKSKLGYNEAGWGLISLPFYVVASIGVGWLAAYLIETPFLALRDKLFPARAALPRKSITLVSVSPARS